MSDEEPKKECQVCGEELQQYEDDIELDADDEGDCFVLKCSRCGELVCAECVDLEDVPRSFVRRDYLCRVCIRPSETNAREEVDAPEAVAPGTLYDIVGILLGGLCEDGRHHKQRCLEEVLEKILGREGYRRMRINCKINGYTWEPGC